MWRYQQSTGQLHNDEMVLTAIGYSGHEEGLNNPALQSVPNVGPTPQGIYDVGEPKDTEKHGPYVLRLTPKEGTDTFGRSGFLAHGDSIIKPGTASEGCIVLPLLARQRIWDSGDHTIEVVA